MRLSGWIDDRQRPLLPLQSASQQEFLALVDTGCELELLLDVSTADRLGLMSGRLLDLETRPVRGLGGKISKVWLRQMTIAWRDTWRDVTVHILETGDLFDSQEVYRPDAIAGCGLFVNERLVLDFARKIVVVEP